MHRGAGVNYSFLSPFPSMAPTSEAKLKHALTNVLFTLLEGPRLETTGFQMWPDRYFFFFFLMTKIKLMKHNICIKVTE